MPSKTRQPASEPVTRTRVSQAELFSKFDYLNRHRAAVSLATRLLRILDSAPPDIAVIALEIATIATRTQANPNGQSPTPAVNAPVDNP